MARTYYAKFVADDPFLTRGATLGEGKGSSYKVAAQRAVEDLLRNNGRLEIDSMNKARYVRNISIVMHSLGES